MHMRLLLLLLLLAPLAAWAKDSLGVRLYERGEYRRAVRVLRSEVDSPLSSEEEKARSRMYLAASLYMLGKKAEARQELETLVQRHPEQRVDPERFSRGLVALAKDVRAAAEAARQAERERLAAEAEAARRQQEEAAEAVRREEEARRQREEEEARRQQEQVATPVAPVVEARSRWRLRPEATGFADMRGRTWGVGAGLTFGHGGLEGSARAVLGDETTYELEGGFVLGDGFFQPRVAVRGSAIPTLRIYGAGAMVGARLNLSPQFVALADVGAVYFFLPSRQVGDLRSTQFGVLASVGLGFNLLSP
jgi:tetratricopeptide (TPR) repeat protein